MSADATEVKVNEPTAGMTTTTGFFEHNSVLLHIDDELVIFSGVSQKSPPGFTGIKRGALGTRPAAHERGAKVRHLKECFGLLVPDVKSSLFEEIAANHASVVNQCGFDGIYLDAIDGSAILRGPEECWYWADKFVVEIQKRLQRPVGMEMSAMWHHGWQYRTRGRAWDFPRRGQKRFIDIHAEKENSAMMLPPHLGWWAFHTFSPPQIEPSYPDVIEHLGARLIGWDAGVSLAMGLDEQKLRDIPLFQRAADTLRVCETLRQTKAFDEAARMRLRDPRYEFTLQPSPTGRFSFRPTQSHQQTVSLKQPWTLAWQVTNAFAIQPARFRIEALSGTDHPNATGEICIADLSTDDRGSWKTSAANGVELTLNPARPRDVSNSLCTITATNTGVVPRNSAWGKIERHFSQPLDLQGRQAVMLEIEGDGSGADLAIRLESPRNIAHGAIADRYVTLDFTGRRRFSLVETEAARWSDYQWGDRTTLYQAYRELVDFSAIERVSFWLHNLPAGRRVRVGIGPAYATRLKQSLLRDPQVTGSGGSILFPVELPAGGWIEANGPDDCTAYGPKGELLKMIKPEGKWPMLHAGENKIGFSYQPDANVQVRAKVVFFTRGEAIEGKQ